MRTAFLVALPLASLVVLGTASNAPIASAQTGGGTGGGTGSNAGLAIVQVKDPDGTVRVTSGSVPPRINAADCAAPDQTTITFQSSVNPASGFDLWVSSNSDCSSTAARTGTTQTCWDLGVPTLTSLLVNRTFTLTLADLTVPTHLDPCATSTSNGALEYLFAFDSGQETTTGDLNGINTYSTAIRVDPNPPVAPVIDSPGTPVSGSSEVSISWTAITDGDMSNIFYQVVNTGESCSGGTSGDAGVAGGGSGTVVKNNINGTSAQVDPSSFVSTTGEGRIVAVRAVDVAGNEGELSQGKCVVFVQTVGFCDVFGAMGGDCDAGGCSVTAPGRKTRDAAPLGLVVLGVAVAVARRRRKSA